MSLDHVKFDKRDDYLPRALQLVQDFDAGRLEFQRFVLNLEDAALSALAAEDAHAEQFHELWIALEEANALMLADAEQGYVREGFNPNIEIPRAIAAIRQFLTTWAESEGLSI